MAKKKILCFLSLALIANLTACKSSDRTSIPGSSTPGSETPSTSEVVSSNVSSDEGTSEKVSSEEVSSEEVSSEEVSSEVFIDVSINNEPVSSETTSESTSGSTSEEISSETTSEYQTSFEDYPIIDLDPDNDTGEEEDFDDSQKYTYTDALNQACGLANKTYAEDGSAIYTTGYTGVNLGGVGGVLLTNESTPFPYGTISVDVTNTTTYDSGIVFGLTGNGSTSYWESDVSYYLFFLNGSNAVLGSINKGVWTNHTTASLSETVDASKTYNLKVIRISDKVLCYVNDELMFGYKLNGNINGTGYGLRSWASAVQFSNLKVTNEYLYGE